MENSNSMLPQFSDNMSFLKTLIGQKLKKIHLIVYEYKGRIVGEDTLIQLLFENNLCIHFLSAGDGDSLRIIQNRWIDPFSEKKDSETKDFIERYGKWILKDASSMKPFSYLMDSKVDAILPIEGLGKMVGVYLKINEYYLKILIDGDECHVSVE